MCKCVCDDNSEVSHLLPFLTPTKKEKNECNSLNSDKISGRRFLRPKTKNLRIGTKKL